LGWNVSVWDDATMPISRSQWVGWRFLALTLTAWAGAAWIAWRYQLNLPATILTLLPGMGAAYLAWAQFRAGRQDAASLVPLEQVADQLAIALRTQWEAEAARQRLTTPTPPGRLATCRP
jgi:hypothetical protein